MRRFRLVREVDMTGISGVGVVAEGVGFSDGTVVLRWFGDQASTAVYASLADMRAIHGHYGSTRVEWLDGE